MVKAFAGMAARLGLASLHVVSGPLPVIFPTGYWTSHIVVVGQQGLVFPEIADIMLV